MHIIEKALIDLLRNHLSLPNEKIFTGSRYRPIDMSPCVTIQQVSEVQVSTKHIPGSNEIIKSENNVEAWINIWCNTEEQRESLVDEVETRIFQALANHYTTCAKYHDGNCDFLNDECATLNITNGRTAKNQCPYPHTYEYCNWFKKNNILQNKFIISGTQEMDELDLSKPILRSIIKIDANYIKLYNIGGHQIENLLIDEELL